MNMDDNGLQTACCDTRWSQQLSGLPHKLLQSLMPFQRQGVEFALSKNGRCMIADEMGLGKTVQAIAVAYAFRQEWPLLVVVPSFLKYLWTEELQRWIPELQPGDINLVEKKSHTTGISSSKVTVLGYGLLTTDARPLVEALSRQRFAVVVVDESHYLKSRNAVRTKILVPLIQNANRAILLTGTPALGRPEELFTQIDALYPTSLGTWSQYTKKYCNAHFRYFGARRHWDTHGASNLKELHQRLTDFMIRRLKAEVLSQLPPKIRQRIPFDLPKKAAKEASASFAKWKRLMEGLASGVVGAYTQVLGLVTQMYKQTAIAKAGAVKDYIKTMLEAEQLKLLVFAHHLTMLQACTEAAIDAKVGYIRIDGSVPSSERLRMVHKFQNNPGVRVAILSIQAAGQGFTFTAAKHVVFAELYWNPGHMKQAEDRAHRIGQTSSVNVHYLIAKGTFDTYMWSMLNRKEMVTGSMLNGREEYLKAEEGDKDKWEFLNFADAWTRNKRVLPLYGNSGKVKDDVFFTHFERDKQHDIRSFFSPGSSTEKKRKRTGDGETSASVSSESEPPRPQQPPSAERDRACIVISSGSDSEPELRRSVEPNKRQLKDWRAEDAGAAQPVHPGLQFCASQHTDRIYLYSKDGTPLNLSFVPLDIKLTYWDDLPEAFSRRWENRKQVLRCVEEWISLAAMKRKLLKHSGLLFHSPMLGLQQLAAVQHPHSSTKSRVQESSEAAEKPSESGFLQAVDSEGIPLCLSCQEVCSTRGGAWDTRFCSNRCHEEFQLRSSQKHMRSRVLEAEQGVCQHCGLHAHDLFLKVRDTPPSLRKDMLENTLLAKLSLKQLNKMIHAPVEGDFWQVDHIRPVYSGGGQCSLDNLQTLCTVCHRARTAQQAKERSQMRKSAAASKVATDISSFLVRE